MTPSPVYTMKLSVFFSLLIATISASSENLSHHSLRDLEPLSSPFKAEYPTYFNENNDTFLQSDFLEILKEVPMREGSSVGIVDRGESCYADSVIQMLFRMPIVRKIVANLDIYHLRVKLLDGYNILDLEDIFFGLKVLEGLNHMFYQLQTNETESATYNFGLSMQVLPGEHAKNGPGDADEYLNLIISALREITPKSQHHHFSINFLQINGDSRPQNHEIDSRISLPILREGQQSLDQLLDDYFAPETIEFGTEAIIRSKKITSLPEIITIHLQRASFERIRIRNVVMMPDEIDLEKYSVCSTSKYRLKMFIVHLGEFSRGHFISHCRNNSSSSSWSTFDDSSVAVQEDPEIIQKYCETGFIYFYEKISEKSNK